MYLALGTSAGLLALYSYARGEVDPSFKGTHSAAITDLYFDELDAIFSCGLDSKVVQWSLKSGKQQVVYELGKDKPTALEVTDEYLVTASKQIKVWDLKTKKVIKTLVGHQSDVHSLRAFYWENKTFCLSVSKADRVVSLWCLNDDSTNAHGSFITDDSISHLSYQISGSIFFLTAINRTGMAQVFSHNIKKIKPSKPIKKKTNLLLNTAEGNVLPIIASVTNEQILIAYGDRFLLRFEIIAPDFNVSESILTREDPKKVKRPKEDLAHNTLVPIVEKNAVEYSNQVTASRKSEKLAEIPLQVRLQSITLAGPPQPKNMVKLLMQGLVSKDSTILEMVFQVTDEETAVRTLSRLPPQFIGDLVEYLSSQMLKRTTHVNSAVIWLKILVQVQTSQLMALGNEHLKDVFSVCLGIIDHRVAHATPLFALHGRLDMLVAQLKRSQKNQNDFDMDNMLVYEDDSGKCVNCTKEIQMFLGLSSV